MIRLLVADNIRLVRESLAHVLGEREELAIVGTPSSADSCIAMTRDLEPSVVLVSMRMAGSDELIRSIVDNFDKTKVVALGECGLSEVVTVVDGSLNDVVAAVHAAVQSPPLTMPFRPAGGHQAIPVTSLTHREEEIVALIERGLSNKEIAQALHMSFATVKNHVHHILTKLHVESRGRAAALVRSMSASHGPDGLCTVTQTEPSSVDPCLAVR